MNKTIKISDLVESMGLEVPKESQVNNDSNINLTISVSERLWEDNETRG